MKLTSTWLWLIALLAAVAGGGVRLATAAQSQPAEGGSLPRVFLFDSRALAETKARLAAGDKSLSAAMGRLKREADKALKAGPFSVVNTGHTPPSGDKHDYISLSRYGWPNPNSPNGLPYVIRDGESNPEGDTDQYSKTGMTTMSHAVNTLALAYYFTEQEAYAAHAAKLLRVFFLDRATRMNPHLEYAQGLPGKSPGRSSGIIDSRELTYVVEAIGLLGASAAWSKADQKGMEAWFRDYLQWLLTSKNGQTEAKATNNHGVWYDVQVVMFALFVGQNDTAKRVVEEAMARRIAAQIEPDGSQPLELKRTRSLSYVLFNIEAFFDLATLADRVGVDLWNFQSNDGRSMRKAFEFVLPYTVGGQKWEHQQITKYEPDKLFPLLRRAAVTYREPRYEAAIARIPGDLAADRTHLLYPPAGASRSRSISDQDK